MMHLKNKTVHGLKDLIKHRSAINVVQHRSFLKKDGEVEEVSAEAEAEQQRMDKVKEI